MNVTAPHYVRDYRRMVRGLLARHDRPKAMELSVGGNFEQVGRALRDVVRAAGLEDGHRIVDVGCGSGRLAVALREAPVSYHGTDVVPELLVFAQERCARPDWLFSLVVDLKIPASSRSADFVVMFSVLTHLSPREGRAYLAEAARVVRPGGRVIVSFLDPAIAEHRRAHGGWLRQLYGRLAGRYVKSVTLRKDQLQEWGYALGLRSEFFGPEWIGQSYVIFTK